MKVVLLDNMKGIGKVGDLKEVSDGYARNFLLPRGLGRPANASVIKDVAALKKRKLESQSLGRTQALAVIATLKGATIVLAGRASEKGTLFSGISRTQIAEALTKLAGVYIGPEAVETQDHLKTLGFHTVHIRLADDAQTDVAVQINAL